jgi:ABC-type antimicrobial peptide transport system permease subunit
MVVRETLVLFAGGIAAGLVAALALGRYVTPLLFGLTPADSAAIGGVVSLVMAVGIAAAALPSRRAARIDPVRALRCE